MQVVVCTQSSAQPSSTGSFQVCNRVIITSLHLSPVAGSILCFCHEVEPLLLFPFAEFNLAWARDHTSANESSSDKEPNKHDVIQ